MAISAAIQFTQGLNTDLPGRALVGITAALVVTSNGDDTDANAWTWILVSVPIGSGVPLGTFSVSATGSFTPDVPGPYLVRLVVEDISLNQVRDERVFSVPTTNKTWVIPAFQGSDTAHNFGGQTRGWAGTGTPKLLDTILDEIETGTIQTLAQTLVNGSTTGGSNIRVTSGDTIQGDDGLGFTPPASLPMRGGHAAPSFVSVAGGFVNLSGGNGNTPTIGSGGSGGWVVATGGNGGSSINPSFSGGSGGSISLIGGSPGTAPTTPGAGGAISLAGGNGVSPNGTAGSVSIEGGVGAGTGFSGGVTISGGNTTSGTPGVVTLNGGDVATTGNGAGITLTGGLGGSSSGNGGTVALFGGNNQAVGATPGGVGIFGGTSVGGGGTGGSVGVTGGPGDTGGQVTISGGSSFGGGSGGGVTMFGANGTGINKNGGTLDFEAGDSTGTAFGGYINLFAGSTTTGVGGYLVFLAGPGGTTGSGGEASLQGGNGGSVSGNGGSAILNGGGIPIGGDGDGGPAYVYGANGLGTNRSGGDVGIQAGSSTGTGAPGDISLQGYGGDQASAVSDRHLFGTVQTDAGTPTKTVATFVTGSNSSVIKVEAHAIARDSAGDAAHFYMVATFKKSGVGVITQLGITSVLHYEADDPTWMANYTFTGANIDLDVTGDAVNDTNWSCTLIAFELVGP